MSNTENNYTETDLGNISLNPRGEYNSSTAYEYLDAVSYQGGSYFCLTELETTITGIAPDPGHNSEHWQMLALPGNMTPEYIAMHDDVINKAKQVETSRAAVELSQQEIESAQADVQQLHSDTVQAAQEAENSRDSAAGYAQSAEQSRKSASESEQNINAQITGFDDKVTESVNQAKEEIDSTRQQAINAITSQQDTSVNTIKTEGEKIITKVEKDTKTVADDRAAVEAAAQTVADNAQEVAQNTQNVASNTENAAASAESAKTFADNAAQSAKSVEDASKQIEQNKKDVTSLKEDLGNKITKFYASNQGEAHITDSDNGKIQDMMIYGKSLQDGTPSPENPVEIKSVVNPTVKVSNEDGTKVQSVTLNNITLNAIPVSSGGNVTIDGRQYIADYVDVERGKHIQMIQTDKVQSNAQWTIQKQQNGYSLGYRNLYANGILTNKPGMGNTWKSNMGDSSASWGSNGFSFGRSTVFWIIPYENDGNITSDDINTWLAEHPMDIMYPLAEPIETDLAPKETEAFKTLATNYSATNISVNSEQLDGYTVFNYPISMANGWNYVKQQLNDNRDYIYDMDLQSAEAYVNSEYAVALTELEV